MAAVAVRGYDVTRIKTGQDGRGAGGFGNINIGDMETRHTLTSNGNGGPGLALNNRRRALAGRVEHLYGGGGVQLHAPGPGAWVASCIGACRPRPAGSFDRRLRC